MTTETAYRAGDKKRPKTDMCKIAAKLSVDETAAIAKDLAADPFVKAKQPFDAAKAAIGTVAFSTRSVVICRTSTNVQVSCAPGSCMPGQ